MNLSTLTRIKTLHTVIWAVMASACIYVLYAGVTNTKNSFVWLCIALILFEGLVLLVNKGSCPLTPLARKHTMDQHENFDIYLPEWLAKYNKQIFTTIFIIGLVLVLVR